MRRIPQPTFPVSFALLTAALFVLLYRPAWGSAAMTSAVLVLLTALGWSSLIVFGGKEMRRRQVAYPAFSLLASLLLLLAPRPFVIEPLAHGLMVGLQALGMLGIVLYLRSHRKKGEPAHD
jgi:hypothetical protein